MTIRTQTSSRQTEPASRSGSQDEHTLLSPREAVMSFDKGWNVSKKMICNYSNGCRLGNV
ncbi:MAG: hypothetical protein KF722_15755 [Nitrospira sp.]|nr:hypothetical protein [Nitrospira sp.]